MALLPAIERANRSSAQEGISLRLRRAYSSLPEGIFKAPKIHSCLTARNEQRDNKTQLSYDLNDHDIRAASRFRGEV